MHKELKIYKILTNFSMDISVTATEFRFVHCTKGTGLVINNAINNVGKLIYI